jgi:WD40 repeat protein/transcriptional regulator with XRE-family HTH domain
MYKPERTKSFGANIKRLLVERNLSQRQFAKLANLTPDYISKLVNGLIAEPRQDIRVKIAQGLGITETKLLEVMGNYSNPQLEETQVEITNCLELASTIAQVSQDSREAPDVNDFCGLSTEATFLQLHEDWGEAVDVEGFRGREKELLELEQWILGLNSQRCRLVAVLGMGGMGKTSLAARIAKKLGRNFDYLIWRSLRNSPPFGEILTQLLQFLSHNSEPELPDNDNSKILRLIDILKKRRCLVILDNVESILRSGEGKTYERAGECQPGYENYGYLLQKVAEAAHQSCLLITSREKPKEVAVLAGKNLPVKVSQLSGLYLEEAKAILEDKGLKDQGRSFSDAQFSELVSRYSGNPLALKMVATTIYDLFGNDVQEFLNQIRQETAVYGDICTLLDQQFNRLSELEKQLMYWLAIARESVSLTELKAELITPEPANRVLEAVESLLRRSFIEKEVGSNEFGQQSVVMEYVTERLIEKVSEEIIKGKTLGFVNAYPLMKARSLDYIRQIQERLILEPVKKKLLNVFGNELESHLLQMINSLQQHSPAKKGYVAGNLINLLRQLQIRQPDKDQPDIELSQHNFSNLIIWQAYFKDVKLKGTSFTNADLTGSVFKETMASLQSVGFSRNGEYFATGVINGEVRLWRTADTKQLCIYKGHTGWIWALDFSPNNQLLATGSGDYTIKLWDIDTGECLHTLKEHTNKVYSVAFNLDGRILASGSEDETIKLWDVKTGDCLKTLKEHTGCVWSVTFSPVDNGILASGSGDGTIKLWNIYKGECLKTLKGHTSQVCSVTFSPDGQMLASSSEDQTIKLWDLSTGKCKKTLEGYTRKVYKVRFSPDGKTLGSCGEDWTIQLWNIYTSECLRNLQGHTSQVWDIAFSPDGRTLLSSSDDQTARLWDVATGNCLNELQGYTRDVYSVAFSPNSKILASGRDDHMIRLWDLDTYKYYPLKGHKGRIRSVAFSPDGQMLASGSADHTIKLWDIRDIGNSKCIRTLTGHSNWVWTVVFSPDGQSLASSSEDRTIRVWNTNTGSCLKKLEGHNYWIWTVAFSPDGQTLASGSANSTVKLWNLLTGQCIETLTDHKDSVWSVAFSPDGKILASGSEDQTVKLWNLSTGECFQTLEGHSKQVYSVVFSPDGQILATGSGDATVRLWKVSTGDCLGVLRREQTGEIRSVAFSSDGHLLACGGEDENIQLWDVDTRSQRQPLKSNHLYERMDITGVIGLTNAEKASLKALGAIERGK